MPTTTPLRLAGLRELADQHYDLGVLAMMQNDALFLAIEELEIHGASHISAQAVVQRANTILPSGVALQQMYFRRYAGLASEKVEKLEAAGVALATCADNLEAIAARVLSQELPMQAMLAAEQVIGERYAQLIQGARTLEAQGVISVRHSERLSRLATRPEDGPLTRFYDKAVALLEHHQNQIQRERRAA